MSHPRLFDVPRVALAGNALPPLPKEPRWAGSALLTAAAEEEYARAAQAWEKKLHGALTTRWQGYSPEKRELLLATMTRQRVKRRLAGQAPECWVDLEDPWTIDKVIEKCASRGVSLTRPLRVVLDLELHDMKGVSISNA